MTSPRERLQDESGVTLVELMTAMVLGLVVMFAALTTLENFSHSASRQTRVTDANDQVRSVMDRVVSDLRQARTIEVASPDDLVYTVVDSATQTRRERICLDFAGRLWRSRDVTASPPVTPIAAGSACPIAGSGAFHVTELRSSNTVSNPIFSYDSATPASVRSVGMTFSLDAGNVREHDTSTLRASAFVRSRGESAPSIEQDDISTVCDSSGPQLTLSLSVGALSVAYTDVDGVVLGRTDDGSAVQLPLGVTKVLATVTTAGGGVTHLLKELAC
jgi:type II secretory pathway pseudopilin PulG